MRRLPSLHALRAFEAASRLGSLVRAADELHLTPSAISHQVRALEDHFGRKLFAAGSRSRTLSDDGARLAAGLLQAFDAIETACGEVTPRASASTLAVHCAPSFAAKWLGPRLGRFIDRFPTISIRLSSGAGGYDLLRHEETDVAVVYGIRAEEPGLSFDPLGEEAVTALCTPALAERALAERAPAGRAGGHDRRAMMALPRIESSVSPIRWSDWFAANGLGRHPPTPLTGFDRGALVVSAAVQGMGVALESERFVQAELSAGQLVVLGGDRFRPIRRVLHHLVSRSGPQLPHRVRVFRTWLLEEVEADRGAGSRPG